MVLRWVSLGKCSTGWQTLLLGTWVWYLDNFFSLDHFVPYHLLFNLPWCLFLHTNEKKNNQPSKASSPGCWGGAMNLHSWGLVIDGSILFPTSRYFVSFQTWYVILPGLLLLIQKVLCQTLPALYGCVRGCLWWHSVLALRQLSCTKNHRFKNMSLQSKVSTIRMWSLMKSLLRWGSHGKSWALESAFFFWLGIICGSTYQASTGWKRY